MYTREKSLPYSRVLVNFNFTRFSFMFKNLNNIIVRPLLRPLKKMKTNFMLLYINYFSGKLSLLL